MVYSLCHLAQDRVGYGVQTMASDIVCSQLWCTVDGIRHRTKLVIEYSVWYLAQGGADYGLQHMATGMIGVGYGGQCMVSNKVRSGVWCMVYGIWHQLS